MWRGTPALSRISVSAILKILFIYLLTMIIDLK